MRSTILADDDDEQPPTETLSGARAIITADSDEKLVPTLARHLPIALCVLLVFVAIVFALDGMLTFLAPR